MQRKELNKKEAVTHYCQWRKIRQMYKGLSECMLTAGLWQISTSWLREASLLVLGEGLRRRLLLNLLPRPCLIQWVQSELALACCLSIIMETTRRGNKQTKQAAHVPMTKVNKQKNKQTNKRQHMWGADAGGDTVLHNLWSLLHNMSEYTEGLQRCSEKCGVWCTRSYSDKGIWTVPLGVGAGSKWVWC